LEKKTHNDMKREGYGVFTGVERFTKNRESSKGGRCKPYTGSPDNETMREKL